MTTQRVRVRAGTSDIRGNPVENTQEYHLLEINDLGWAVICHDAEQQVCHCIEPENLDVLEVIGYHVEVKPGTRDRKGYFLHQRSGYQFQEIDDHGWAVICANPYDVTCHHVDPDNIKVLPITKSVRYNHFTKK